MVSYEQYVRESVLEKEEIDVFLSPAEPSWAQFDSELGYTLGNFMPRDGLDGSLTISTSTANGARRSAVYADRDCRINTYGNSFTQCHQVSDHETWQEYLAAHLGEPIRNFGMGGYGAFQSYRRMCRTETSDLGADYAILYIWGDDHYRSVLRCRHVLSMGWHRQHRRLGGRMLHGNFWSNVEMDLDSGQLVERDSALPTPEQLYQMTDADFMFEALHDDLMLQMSLYCRGETGDVDTRHLEQLADALDRSPVGESTPESVGQLRTAYAFAATRYILDHAAAFATAHNMNLLVVLFCPTATRQLIDSGDRYDQPVVDYLEQRGQRYFDMNLVHVEDYNALGLSLEKYMKRYFIGHYSPAGNHFFAFSIKDEIVDWLDPKPVTYRQDEQVLIDFREGYLE